MHQLITIWIIDVYLTLIPDCQIVPSLTILSRCTLLQILKVHLLEIILQDKIYLEALSVPYGTLKCHRVESDASWILVQSDGLYALKITSLVLKLPNLHLLVLR